MSENNEIDRRDSSKLEGLIREVLNRENTLKKISVSVAATLLAASLMGTVLVYKEFVHVQEWANLHEKTAERHFIRITALEEKANQGGRWTLEMHTAFSEAMKDDYKEVTARVISLERQEALTQYKLGTIDEKLDLIIQALRAEGPTGQARLRGPAM